jgi:NAD(P)-dependent dehydrogenase (short-subunit alcohol dehydrogenase family)
MAKNKTAIVTGAQQGIGAGLVDGFVDAVLYLADASEVTGEVLHVDGGAQIDVGSFRNSK